MIETTKVLIEDTGAVIGYTQSDEISLIYYSLDYKSQIFLNGRIQKMTSILASIATAHFNLVVASDIPEKTGRKAHFDCKAWQVPNLVEASNTLLWRELDATKNSVSMAAREFYSHKKLHKQGCSDQMDMLMAKGVNWNDYPVFFKRGTYLQKRNIIRTFSAEEIEKLPAKHEARNNPNLQVERTDIRILDMPPFVKVMNKEEVVFFGADPVTEAPFEGLP
jgi:tRNA(His) 5'-end guanylyltransferase